MPRAVRRLCLGMRGQLRHRRAARGRSARLRDVAHARRRAGSTATRSSAGSMTRASTTCTMASTRSAIAGCRCGRYMAAVLACGDGAVLSHRRRLAPPPPAARSASAAEVTVPTRRGTQRPGIVIHRVQALASARHFGARAHPDHDDPRPLLDIAPELAPRAARRGLPRSVGATTPSSPRHIEACIARNPTKPGAEAPRALAATSRSASSRTRSSRCCASTGCRSRDERRSPRRQGRLPLARSSSLTVELLSYRFHASRRAFEADVARRRRSNHLAFRCGDVVERGARTIAELRRALASHP